MRRAATCAAGGAGYLLFALAAWWPVWQGGVAHTVTSDGWGDPAQQIWYLGWLPHALGAGIDPLVSHAMFAPAGINLMANTSILFPALAVSPVTVLFGPLVAFNVLVVLAPAVSAFAAWRVFCRHTSFEAGAYLGGLFFGFSPFVLNDLGDGHLHVTLLVFVPLVLALVDDIAVSQRGSPVVRGLLLGLVVVGQALTSLEVLAIVALMAMLILAVLALWNRAEVGRRLKPAAEGFGVAGLTAVLLLAWPISVLLRGPRRYRGTVFVSPESYVVWLKALVWPRGGAGALPQVWAGYIGIPLLVAIAIGAWRLRSGVLRLACGAIAIGLVFAMGRTVHLTPAISAHVPLPDRLVTRLPFLDDLLPVRFMIVIDLFVALALAVLLGGVRDRLHDRAERRRLREGGGGWAAGGRASGGGRASRLAATGAFGLGVVLLLSPALGAGWPYPVRQVSVPPVYRSNVVADLRPGSVLLAYPVMNGFAADPMIWQAETNYHYDMVAGYGFIPGPGPHPLGSLPPSPITVLFGDAELGILPAHSSATTNRAVLAELKAWRVDDIVVMPEGKQYALLVKMLSGLLNRPSRHIDGSYVWTGIRTTS